MAAIAKIKTFASKLYEDEVALYTKRTYRTCIYILFSHPCRIVPVLQRIYLMGPDGSEILSSFRQYGNIYCYFLLYYRKYNCIYKCNTGASAADV